MSDTAPTMREVIARTDAEAPKESSTPAESREPREPREPKVPRETKGAEDRVPVNTVANDDDDPLSGWNEAPAWAKRWGKDSQKALRGYASDPNNGENWKHVGNELNKLYTDWGRQANEVGQLRQWQQQVAPIQQMLEPWRQRFEMQGTSLENGVKQLLAVSDSLARDPDNTLAWIASQIKPKDAGKLLQTIAQVTGADLSQVAQAQPYVDPTITSMVNPLLQRLQSLEGHLSTQQQQAVQFQQHQVLQHIQAFENAVDESGQPKHPYLRDPEVFSLMLTAMNNGHTPRDLSAAYDWATARHLPAIQQKAKAAQDEALRKAAATTENSNQARVASNNLQSSAGKGRAKAPPNSIRDAIRETAKRNGETIPSTW